MFNTQLYSGSLMSPPKTTKDLPQRPLARMATKLYLLGALAWDYADTVCNIAASLRICETKPASRAVREL